MKTGNKYFIIGLYIILLTSSAFQCNKRIGCGETVYNFEMGIRAYPDKEVIRIGDTIWLEVNEPTNLYEQQTGKHIDFNNAKNLGSVIAFQKLSNTNEFVLKAAKDFDFKLIEGIETRNVDPESLKEFLFIERNNLYMFKIGVIPKKTGTFRLFFSNASNVYQKENKCKKANFVLNFKETSQHLNLYPGLVDSTYGSGVYYFKVE